ncbi:type II secretion system protein GspD [Pandoraea bronchicola]|uniref:type II secretion system protein GspD n=1 Tax=Pandoraea bronchicola TaxID=2508287 RepID=UPI001240FDDF|nr:type II secretory pathway protein [Pandoraea bronchicola]
MKRSIIALAVAFVGANACAAEAQLPLPPRFDTALLSTSVALPTNPLKGVQRSPSGAFDLRYVNVGQLVDLLYSEALGVPHVISSDVLQDTRLVSFRYDGKGRDLHSFVLDFLDSQGFAVTSKSGVDYVSRKSYDERKKVSQSLFVYRPRFRTAAYLARAVEPVLGAKTLASARPFAERTESDMSAPPSDGTAVGQPGNPPPRATLALSAADELTCLCTDEEIKRVAAALKEIDAAAGEVLIRGWVYEVSNTRANNSAFSIAARAFGTSVSMSNGATDSDPTALRFSSSGLDMALSLLNADTRFKQISDPHVRVTSGERVRLNVGSRVPTLGSISYQGASGTPVQSVTYQDAGLIFEVEPVVMQEAIEVRLTEQISSFVPTTNGVNNSPTKNTREIKTTISAKDGEVILLGGLVQDGDSSTKNSPGWLPSFLDGHSASSGRTEVVLVLQVQRVKGGAQ